MSRLGLAVARLGRLLVGRLVAAALFATAPARRSAALRPAAAASGRTAARRPLVTAEQATGPAVLPRRVVVPVLAAERRLVRVIHYEVLVAALAVAGLAVAGSLQLFLLRRRDSPLGQPIAQIAGAEGAPLGEKKKRISISQSQERVHSLPTGSSSAY